MAHGSPDWWGAAPTGTTHKLADMGELAARLGSIVTFDRRGDVIMLDDFNGGLSAWGWGGTGVMTCNLITNPCVSGSLAIQITAPSGADDEGWARRVLPYPVLSKIGFETWFNPHMYLKYYYNQMGLFTGSNLIKYTARYDHDAGTIEIEDPADTWTVIGTPGVLRTGSDCYSVLKLVVDSLAGDYVRVICNNHQYDASAKSGVVTEDALTAQSMTVVVGVVNIGEYVLSVDVDNIIVTQNEPS